MLGRVLHEVDQSRYRTRAHARLPQVAIASRATPVTDPMAGAADVFTPSPSSPAAIVDAWWESISEPAVRSWHIQMMWARAAAFRKPPQLPNRSPSTIAWLHTLPWLPPCSHRSHPTRTILPPYSHHAPPYRRAQAIDPLIRALVLAPRLGGIVCRCCLAG